MTAAKLVKACNNNTFPDIDTVTSWGLDGHGGTNPVSIFSCYRRAINDGVTEQELTDYMERGRINELILERQSGVKCLSCYEKVLQMGGIKISKNDPQRECSQCQHCAEHDDICFNCGSHIKI
jgi:hypothetical protein